MLVFFFVSTAGKVRDSFFGWS